MNNTCSPTRRRGFAGHPGGNKESEAGRREVTQNGEVEPETFTACAKSAAVAAAPDGQIWCSSVRRSAPGSLQKTRAHFGTRHRRSCQKRGISHYCSRTSLDCAGSGVCRKVMHNTASATRHRLRSGRRLLWSRGCGMPKNRGSWSPRALDITFVSSSKFDTL